MGKTYKKEMDAGGTPQLWNSLTTKGLSSKAEVPGGTRTYRMSEAVENTTPREPNLNYVERQKAAQNKVDPMYKYKLSDLMKAPKESTAPKTDPMFNRNLSEFENIPEPIRMPKDKAEAEQMLDKMVNARNDYGGVKEFDVDKDYTPLSIKYGDTVEILKHPLDPEGKLYDAFGIFQPTGFLKK